MWQEHMNDEGVTDAFWEGGWPADYPTRSLEDWKEIVGSFVSPDDFIGQTGLPNRKQESETK